MFTHNSTEAPKYFPEYHIVKSVTHDNRIFYYEVVNFDQLVKLWLSGIRWKLGVLIVAGL